MLKKYSDYVNDPIIVQAKIEQVIENIDEKQKDIETDIETAIETTETIIFEGKVVTFLKPIKPSATIGLLESKKISKDKLHFIITEQKDSLVILKYNLETEIKLNLFVETLIKYHKQNTELKELFENIESDGSDTFTIIKNIPNKNIKNLITQNIKKLLK